MRPRGAGREVGGSPAALVITYHAIESGPPPLCLDPRLLARHLDVIAAAPVRPISLGRLVAELRDGGPSEPSVAITFDDGFASVAEHAAPMLSERGLPATVFCVAGHVGGRNDFPTDPGSAPKRALADAEALRRLVAAGFEVGSHGSQHSPLAIIEHDEAALEREVVQSRDRLQRLLDCPVRWFAPPYASPPGGSGRALIERAYDGACGAGLRAVGKGADPYALPRVDAHYLRHPALLRRALTGGVAYLALRRAGARARRLVRQDFVSDD